MTVSACSGLLRLFGDRYLMTMRHAVPVRGLDAKRSALFQGKFGRMFRSLPPASFGKNEDETIKNLHALANAMESKNDDPKDAPDDEESGIPALYTYFGQFIDHDITFDPASTLQKQDDPDALIDYRTPAFDLDNVYGRGPDDQPYLYEAEDNRYMLLGNRLKGGSPHARDLPRNQNGRALIGDPRNDENMIVSQLQGILLRFHNAMVDDNPGATLSEVQQLVRFHYQWIVLHDFLPKIVGADVLAQLKDGDRFVRDKLKFFHWHQQPFMPVEFSVAAYRLGHSMVRPGYRLNDDHLLAIFPTKKDPGAAGKHPHSLTGFRSMPEPFAIDWGRFINVGALRDYTGNEAARKKRLQLAYRIDTALVNPLKHLPQVVATGVASLAERNLQRGWRLSLPCGQDVARAMDVTPLSDKEIFIGQAVDNPSTRKTAAEINPVFAGNCPLWTYILAEAALNQTTLKVPAKPPKNGGGSVEITTPQLGAVGGRIVAEVFLGLMFGDNNSMLSLNPQWKPEGGTFGLNDLVQTALNAKPRS
jgi:hypothetical protein